MINGKVTYHQQVTYCGKSRCRKCREGIGHGPYWYAYQTVEGQTIRKYIGKRLPQDVQSHLDVTPVIALDSSLATNLAPLPAPALPPSDQAALQIFTLGQLRVHPRNQTSSRGRSSSFESAWQQRSVRSLLGFLLCQPERKASRAQIVATLWSDEALDVASSALNKDVQTLRKILGHPTVGNSRRERQGEARLHSTGDTIQLAAQSVIWIDSDAFEADSAHYYHTRRSFEDVSRLQLQEREQLLRSILALYNGDFLTEERDAEWALARRQSLRRTWIELQLELVDLSVFCESLSSALDVLDRILIKDPANELAIQRLLLIMFRLKRRSEALRLYKRFQDTLQRQYHAVPSQETLDICDAVQQGREIPYSFVLVSSPHTSALTSLVTQAPLSVPDISILPGTADVIGRAHQSSLVGRGNELTVMHEMLMDVEQAARSRSVGPRRPGGIPLDTLRRPQCLFLMGDSGIGKTRLAEEVSREAQQREWTVVWSRLYTLESGVPYRVWTEVLSKLAAIGPGLFSSLSQDVLVPLATLLPDQISEALLAQREKGLPAYSLAPEQEQQRLRDAIATVLKVMCDYTSLFIVLDDIQWADRSSQDLLAYLSRHLTGYPVVFIATCRNTELPASHPLYESILHMQREHTVRTLTIEPLTNDQIGQLVSSLSPLPDAMVKHIQDCAAGNPFFAEELARSSPPTLPKTVTDALGYRMKRLSIECQQFLGRAAVLGGSFEFQLICAMESDSDDDETVLDLLEEALKAGVLADEGVGTRITYHFWHPLLVDWLYEQVSAIRRARLHQRAADALLAIYRGREEGIASTVSDHLEKAGALPERIAYYAEQAGNNAYSLFAYAEAADHYRRAIKYTQQVGSREAQIHEISLLEPLADCTRILGNYPEARRLYEHILDLRMRYPEVAADHQRDIQVQALIWLEIALIWRYNGNNGQAWKGCERCEQLLREAGVEGGPAWARLFYTQSLIYNHEGRNDQALQSAMVSLPLYEQQLSAPRSISDPKVCRTLIQRMLEGDPFTLGNLYRHMGVIAFALGQIPLSAEYAGKALTLYERYNERRQIAQVECNMGYLYIKKAEYEQAQAALRRALSIVLQIEDGPLVSLIYSNQGELAFATGELGEAEELYKRALELNKHYRDREYDCRWSVGLVGVLCAANKLDEAAGCIYSAWSVARAMRNTPCISLALIALAELRLIQAERARGDGSRQARLLACARRDVQHALKSDQLEVEIRLRGMFTLARIQLELGEHQVAAQDIKHIIAESRRYGLSQIATRAQKLMQGQKLGA